MALLIDTPRWPWRGRLWAHLISDDNLDELHHAARTLGLRWLSFGRDHYDVPDTLWPAACELATLVDSRVIVRSLRTSGLRVGGGKPAKAWRWQPSLPAEFDRPDTRAWLAEASVRLAMAEREFLVRPNELVVLHLFGDADVRDLGPLRDPVDERSQVIETIADGRYSVELVVRA